MRVAHTLKEKCTVAGDCASCGMSVGESACLMNVLRLSLGVTPRPHHGQEYGDAMMQLTIAGRQRNSRILAKRGSSSRLTPGRKAGEELLRQAAAACVDSRTEALVAVVPAPLDDQLRATIQLDAKIYGKFVVFLDDEFVARAVARARAKERGRARS